MPMISRTRVLTLPSFQCEAPDTADVPISARWTDAEARAGARPSVRRRLVEVTP
jgi:hypothetical protein